MNSPRCATERNFKRGGSVVRAKHKHLLLLRSKKDFLTIAQLLDCKTNLQELLVTDEWKNRAILIKNVTAPENNGEGVAYETINQKKYRTDKGTWDKIYLLEACTECEYQQLVKAIEQFGKGYLSVFDENNEAWSLASSTGVGGFPIHQMHMLPPEEATPGATAKYKFRIALDDIDDITKNAVHFPLTDAEGNFFNPVELDTPEDVLFTDITPGGAADGVHRIAITGSCEGCNEMNIAEIYKEELDNIALFEAKTVGGADLSITSVATVSNGQEVTGLTFQFNTSDPDYVNNVDFYLYFDVLSVTNPILQAFLVSNKLKLKAHKS